MKLFNRKLKISAKQTTLGRFTPREEKIVRFHRFIITARRQTDYPMSGIYNMDETPMRFELPSSPPLQFSGSRTVPVKCCGAEKRSFTVTLGVAADGAKLPPKVIFKGIRTLRDLVVPDSLCVYFYKKGWMDEPGVQQLIRQCLPRNPCNEPSLLVWDSFRSHLTDAVNSNL